MTVHFSENTSFHYGFLKNVEFYRSQILEQAGEISVERTRIIDLSHDTLLDRASACLARSAAFYRRISSRATRYFRPTCVPHTQHGGRNIGIVVAQREFTYFRAHAGRLLVRRRMREKARRILSKVGNKTARPDRGTTRVVVLSQTFLARDASYARLCSRYSTHFLLSMVTWALSHREIVAISFRRRIH